MKWETYKHRYKNKHTGAVTITGYKACGDGTYDRGRPLVEIRLRKYLGTRTIPYQVTRIGLVGWMDPPTRGTVEKEFYDYFKARSFMEKCKKEIYTEDPEILTVLEEAYE